MVRRVILPINAPIHVASILRQLCLHMRLPMEPILFLLLRSRTTLVEGSTKFDVDINTGDTSTPTHNHISGLITRARARQLNNQVSSFLASYSSYLDNGNMCSILLLRNDGQERNRVAFAPATFGFQNSSSL
jgi:hypothetical protein